MENTEPLTGILLIDKPTGITSFDVIRHLRMRFKSLGHPKVKMGHSGTLDPAASGLLIVALGRATKQLESMINLNKSYLATVRLGEMTDTLDVDGEIVEESSARHLNMDQVSAATEQLVGCHDYPVPLYSAIKVEGKPLYAYTRAGQTPPRVPNKTMCVESFELGELVSGPRDTIEFSVEFAVTKGTYIRTLAEQIGRNLELPGMLSGLRRLKIGQYSVEQALQIDTVEVNSILPLPSAKYQ